MIAMPSRRDGAWRSALLALAGAILATGAVRAPALESDRDQPIRIVASRAEADEKQRVTIYRGDKVGDAVITQGTLRITGQTIWIYLNDNDEFIKLVSVGTPAHMRQRPDGATADRTANAKRLEYFAERDLIVMLGNAEYGQGKDKISAERIEYDSLKGRMRARAATRQSGTDGTKPGRVIITIQPKKRAKGTNQ